MLRGDLRCHADGPGKAIVKFAAKFAVKGKRLQARCEIRGPGARLAVQGNRLQARCKLRGPGKPNASSLQTPCRSKEDLVVPVGLADVPGRAPRPEDAGRASTAREQCARRMLKVPSSNRKVKHLRQFALSISHMQRANAAQNTPNTKLQTTKHANKENMKTDAIIYIMKYLFILNSPNNRAKN